eukprot:TRINITY_DN328_c0_g1_i1.p1 TRINITY_DN328_c0_g1~~TRINITY_DN328_c0_g1_i1.p1  ORF type:complete len:642 (-),score=34.43 TRINITY_DN328_c0_g1_i1:239-2164(-)
MSTSYSLSKENASDCVFIDLCLEFLESTDLDEAPIIGISFAYRVDLPLEAQKFTALSEQPTNIHEHLISESTNTMSHEFLLTPFMGLDSDSEQSSQDEESLSKTPKEPKKGWKLIKKRNSNENSINDKVILSTPDPHPCKNFVSAHKTTLAKIVKPICEISANVCNLSLTIMATRKPVPMLKKHKIRIIKYPRFIIAATPNKRSDRSVDEPKIEFPPENFFASPIHHLLDKDLDLAKPVHRKSTEGWTKKLEENTMPRKVVTSLSTKNGGYEEYRNSNAIKLFDIQEEMHSKKLNNHKKLKRSCVTKKSDLNIIKRRCIKCSQELNNTQLNGSPVMQLRYNSPQVRKDRKSNLFLGQITLQDYMRRGMMGKVGSTKYSAQPNAKSFYKTNGFHQSKSRVVFMRQSNAFSSSNGSDYMNNLENKSRNISRGNISSFAAAVESSQSSANDVFNVDAKNIDWAKTRFFQRVSNGRICFSNFEDNLFTEVELDSCILLLQKDVSEPEFSKYSEKAYNTLKYLSMEVTGCRTDSTVPKDLPNIIATLKKCKRLFEIRIRLLPIYLLVLERNVLYILYKKSRSSLKARYKDMQIQQSWWKVKRNTSIPQSQVLKVPRRNSPRKLRIFREILGNLMTDSFLAELYILP